MSGGNVPEGWRETTVGEALNVCNNLRLPISTEERNKILGQYPYYGPTGILSYINEYRLDGEYATIGEDGDHFLKYRDRPMTLLINGKFNVNNHAHVLGSTNDCEASWFAIFYMHRDLTPFLTRQGAGRYKLTKAALEKLPILLPPLPEQRKIAAILSTWDDSLSTLGKLLDAKRQQKRGLAEALLTGKRRLPGFVGEWEEKRLGDVLFEPRKVAEVKPHGIELLTVKLHTKGVEKSGKCPAITKAARPYYKRFKDEILIGRQNFHNGGIGIVGEEESGLICSNAISSYVPIRDDLHFVFHYISREAYYSAVDDLIGGTGQKEISRAEFAKLPITIPPLPEQRAIASVLSTLDDEISALTRLRAALERQKRGLMDVLLTGRVRVSAASGGKVGEG